MYSREMMFRCLDEAYAIRPTAEAQADLIKLSKSSPEFEKRYSELIENAIETPPGLVRPSYLKRAASAAEYILRSKR